MSELLWDEANEAHIARHEVSRQEVIQVVFGSKSVFALDDSHRRGRLVVFGVTNTVRHLVVVLDEPTTTGTRLRRHRPADDHQGAGVSTRRQRNDRATEREHGPSARALRPH